VRAGKGGRYNEDRGIWSRGEVSSCLFLARRKGIVAHRAWASVLRSVRGCESFFSSDISAGWGRLTFGSF
jgi:hypothetical protein